jgi:hypothetical protein
VQQFKRLGLKPGGSGGSSYYQPFGSGYQNLLGVLEGSDPELKNEYILIGAHFDHVGYGNSRNSNGPVGFIHNGADDNASGDAALLEVIEAFNVMQARPKRSILFAFWDCEENELNGSRHWMSQPTVPKTSIDLAFNLDMVGRLRNKRLEVVGSRSAPGLRRAVSEGNDTDVLVDFQWEITRNSDHYSFYSGGIPILFIHTGLHGDYHRPSDDPEKLNYDGMRSVTRMVFRTAYSMADAETRPKFRGQSRQEGQSDRAALERALPVPPGRLGIRWDDGDPNGPGVRVIHVDRNSAAEKAGIRIGDRLVTFNNVTIAPKADLRPLVLAASSPVAATLDRSGKNVDVSLQLPDSPVRLGVSWREDHGEPGTLVIVQVVPGSPADIAELKSGDRIYALDGGPFADGNQFVERVGAMTGPVPLTIERSGQIFTAMLPDPVAVARGESE